MAFPILKENDVRIMVTYGFGSNLRNCYSVVEGETLTEIMNKIESVCGRDYAFVYYEGEIPKQAEKYGLFEVPLQRQQMGAKLLQREDVKS